MKAVIFDMDGVVSDTQDLHANVEERILKKHGVSLSSEEISEKYAGVSDKEFFITVFKNAGKEPGLEEINKIIEEKWRALMLQAKSGIKPIEGIFELVDMLKNNNFKLAVASASRMGFVKLVLSRLGITDKFDVLVSSEEVERGKPEPDIFLHTARKLGTKPENCIVIEDGINGMITAKYAGMRCIALVKDKSRKYPADKVVESLKEIKLSDF